jgi:hypothetical protein
MVSVEVLSQHSCEETGKIKETLSTDSTLAKILSAYLQNTICPSIHLSGNGILRKRQISLLVYDRKLYLWNELNSF